MRPPNMLSAEQILKAADLGNVERVDVPEWGGHVFVRVMNGAERDRWELAAADGIEKRSTANVRASLCAATICDENGKRLFTDNQAANLSAKSAIALDRVFTAAKRLNKRNDKDIEELEKN